MIDKIEPDWCYEDRKYEVIDCEDEEEYDEYDLYMADVMHEKMIISK